MNRVKYDNNGIPVVVSKYIGMKYNRLTIRMYSHYTKQSNGTSYNYFVVCVCECGVEKCINISGVTRGVIKSCGCYSSELKSKRFSKHGMSRTSLYHNYRAMLSRCYDKKNKKYNLYGGSGVVVCAGWRGENGFTNFLSDMLPKTDKTVDRKDSKKNYSCGHCGECVINGWDANCRWANYETQNRNTSRNRYIKIGVENLTISQWSRKVGITETLINYRLRSGWTEHDAIFTPVVKGKRTDKRKLYAN